MPNLRSEPSSIQMIRYEMKTIKFEIVGKTQFGFLTKGYAYISFDETGADHRVETLAMLDGETHFCNDWYCRTEKDVLNIVEWFIRFFRGFVTTSEYDRIRDELRKITALD